MLQLDQNKIYLKFLRGLNQRHQRVRSASVIIIILGESCLNFYD